MTLEDIVKVGALLTSFGWLVYWTGRWYKEWYFAQFGIPYEVLGFNFQYYCHGSWATIATAISLLLLVFVPLMLFWCRLWWPYMVLSLVFSAAAGGLQVWHPTFDPEGALWKKVLGSRDIVMILCGLLVFILFMLALILNNNATQTLKQIRVQVPLPWFVECIAIFLLSWAYLAGMGFLMGTYHGQSAIWDGKMGTKWVKHAGSWWLFVVRAEADRNFIYDREARKTKVVKDSEIEEWDGPASRKPR